MKEHLSTALRATRWAHAAAALLIALVLAGVGAPQPAAAASRSLTGAPRLAFLDDNVIYEATAGRPGARGVVWTPAGARKWSPTWSPDGMHLAYVAPLCAQLPAGCAADVGLTGTAIYVAGVRTGKAQVVLSLPHMTIWDLEWSPRGDRFTFTAYKVLETGFVWGLGSAHSDVFVVNTDGTELTPVTADGVSTEPTWASDGKRLAFRSQRGAGGSIYVASADLLSPPILVSTDGLEHSAFSPRWSPDGRSIAYLAYELPPRGGIRSGESEIWIGRLGSFPYGTGVTGYAIDWSPDSRSLAYSTFSWALQRGEIHALRLGGDSRFVIAGEFPRWAPDGRHIAVNVPGRTRPYRNLVMVDVRDGSIVPIRSEAGDYTMSVDYEWTR